MNKNEIKFITHFIAVIFPMEWFPYKITNNGMKSLFNFILLHYVPLHSDSRFKKYIHTYIQSGKDEYLYSLYFYSLSSFHLNWDSCGRNIGTELKKLALKV